MTGSIMCQHAGRYGFTRLEGTDEYVCTECHMPTPGYEQGTAPLVYFRDGPMDGMVYFAHDLGRREYTSVLPVYQYKWTAEKIEGKNTGQIARVWQWRGPESAIVAPPEDKTQDHKENTVAQNTTTDGQHTPETLLKRRQALGLSRTPVASQAGITVSQLGSMETSGKRIKEGVMDKVHAALAHFEAERGATSEPSDKEEDTAE